MCSWFQPEGNSASVGVIIKTEIRVPTSKGVCRRSSDFPAAHTYITHFVQILHLYLGLVMSNFLQWNFELFLCVLISKIKMLRHKFKPKNRRMQSQRQYSLCSHLATTINKARQRGYFKQMLSVYQAPSRYRDVTQDVFHAAESYRGGTPLVDSPFKFKASFAPKYCPSRPSLI